MQRLIEQPVGEGEIVYDGATIGRAHYHLAVYRHFSELEGEPVPAHIGVEGRLDGVDALDLGAVGPIGAELTLRLVDGRLLDFHMTDARGSIHSTGRGLYDAD